MTIGGDVVHSFNTTWLGSLSNSTSSNSFEQLPSRVVVKLIIVLQYSINNWASLNNYRPHRKKFYCRKLFILLWSSLTAAGTTGYRQSGWRYCTASITGAMWMLCTIRFCATRVTLRVTLRTLWNLELFKPQWRIIIIMIINICKRV